MTRKLITRSTFIALVALLAAGLCAQTSPWPFPPRSGSGSTSAVAPSRSVTVGFWNIQWFPGGRPNPTQGDEIRQINMVHADIARLNVDVLGMEEVRNFAQAGVAVQPLRGFKVDVCANFPPREGQTEAQEVAIASRLRALSAWAEEWKPNGAIIPPRGFAFAAYEVAPRKLLLVYAVHLKSNLGDARENIPMREESIRQLRSHMVAMQAAYGKLGNIAWVIGGDWNTSLEDRQFAAEKTLHNLIDNGFAWCWQNVAPGARVTLPPAKGFAPTTFDHIFVRGATIRKAWVVTTSPQSSDHRPVVAILDL
jgi:endonuclease/exonuclease/phosphatase family metal-dependent hydrolase